MDKIHIQKIVREELSHLTEEQKRKILHDLDESKVTPAKVSKAFTKVAEISKLMSQVVMKMQLQNTLRLLATSQKRRKLQSLKQTV